MRVFRQGVELASGDVYRPGERLQVAMSDISGEILLQVSGGAKFIGGACVGSPR